jgi:hypothetical protein
MRILKNIVALFIALILITSCHKEYSAETGIDPTAAWQFFDGTKHFKGSFYDVYDSTQAGVGYLLVFVGITSTKDTVLNFQVYFPEGKIQPGTYNTGLPIIGTTLYVTDASNRANPVYLYIAESRTIGVSTRFEISSYDPVTRIVTGTFSGTAENSLNAPVSISRGRFTAKVR